MGKNKLKRFAELKTFPNVLEENTQFKGKWAKHFFQNSNPITLELACGKGEYSTGLGKNYSQKNFIGIDIKGNRIWKGAKTALDEKLNNVAFLRIRIDHIGEYFSENEVDEIWIIFPDPFLKEKKIKKRLTSPFFLDLYKKILKKDGIIHLKTDDDTLYNFTLENLNQRNHSILELTNDLYNSGIITEDLSIKTFYELQHLQKGKKIKYIRFRL